MSTRARISLSVAASALVIAAIVLFVARREGPTPDESGAEAPAAADATRGEPGLSARTGSTAAAPLASSPTIALVGHVLDDRRSPVGTAAVEGLDVGEPRGATRTSADGSFRVEGLPRPTEAWRSVAVRAVGPDGRVGIGSTVFLTRSSPDVVDAGDVVLGKGTALAVRVVEAGAAVRDAHVALSGDRVWLLQAITGADGVAHFGAMPPQPLEVLAWTSEPPRAGRGRVLPGGIGEDPVAIAIAPARTLEVLVLEVPSGRLIEGATFDVAPVSSQYAAGGAYGPGRPRVEPTGPDGRTRVFGTVADDELSLSRPRAPGFDGEGWGQQVGAGEVKVRLQMRSRRTLRFDVGDGEAPIPADGTPIRLEPSDEGAETPAGRARIEGRTLVVEGASPLSFSAIAVAPDESYARAWASPEVPPPWDRGGGPSAPAQTPQISFRRPRRVSVVALRPDRAPAASAWFAVGNPPSRPVTAVRASDAEGHAEIASLRVESSMAVLLLEDPSLPWSGRRVGTADLTKGDAQVTVVVPDRRRFRVRTTIDGRAGLPPRFRLTVDGLSVEGAQEDATAGTIDFAARVDLDASGVEVSIAAHPLALATTRVAPVPDRDPVEVEIALRSPGSLTCRILEPVDRAYELHVERWDAERSLWTRADRMMGWGGARPGPDGHVSLNPVDPGTYRLRDAGSGLVAGPVEIRGGEESVFPALDLSAASWVAGRVVGPDGEGVVGPRVTVEGPGLVADAGWSGQDRMRGFGTPEPPRGSFRVRVPGGRPVTLRASDPLLEPAAEGGTVTVTGPRDDVVLRLAEGRQATVRLVYPDGVPRWPSGRPRVRLFRGSASGRPESEHEGVLEGDRLRFAGFQPGIFTVWIDLPYEGPAALAPAVLRDAALGEGRTDLGTLRFERGSRVLLRAPVNEGQPAIPVRAIATRLDEPAYERGNQGSPQAIGGLGPGRFRIRVWADGGAASRSVDETREVDGVNDIETTLDLRQPRPTQSK